MMTRKRRFGVVVLCHLWCFGCGVSLVQAQEGAEPEPTRPIEEATPDEPAVDPDRAYKELVQLAQEDFEARRYDDALTALNQAYRLKPSPNLIYNRARILEAKGDMSGALREYETFAVSPDVDLEYRRETLERIRVLKEVIALKEKPADQSSEGGTEVKLSTPQPAIQQPVEVRADERPRPLRRVGAVMMGVGGVTLLAGAGFGYLALNEQNELNNSTELERRRELAANVDRLGRNADMLYIGGGALTVIGLGLFIAGRRPRAASSLRLSPDVSTTQVGMQMSLSF